MKTLTTVEYNHPSTIENEFDYRQAVLSMTDSIIERINGALESEEIEFNRESVEDFVNDSTLHEVLDGCEFTIYNHHHLSIINFSGNEEYAIDNFGSEWVGETLKNDGLSGLHRGLAFWALYADVQECLSDHLDDIDFDIEDEEE